MPDQLKIRVDTQGNANNLKTVSKFSVSDSGHVTIHNDAASKLKISVANPTPLCHGNEPVYTDQINAGKYKIYDVCDGTTGKSFKLTAVVQNAAADNPTVIVEGPISPDFSIDPIVVLDKKPIVVLDSSKKGEDLMLAGGGFLLGVAAAALVMFRVLAGGTRPRS